MRRRKKRIDWDTVPDLGSVSDSIIAKRLGVTKQAVHGARKARGIKAARPKAADIDWAAITDMGIVSDPVIAARIGVAGSTICRKRAELGIPAYVGKGTGTGRPTLPIDWANVGLGQTTDTAIACKLGCAVSTVNLHRHNLGIPAYNRELENDCD